MLKPTEEQETILLASDTEGSLTVEALAGTGKTSTLKMLGERKKLRNQTGLYLAYNKSIQEDAKESFPQNVECRTAHSVAYGKVGFKFKHRLNGERVTGKELAVRLHISNPYKLENDVVLGVEHLARMTMDTVRRFSNSASEEITESMVPFQPGVEPEDFNRIKDIVFPRAVTAWEDIQSTRGTLPFTHDYYLKLWALSDPRIDKDFIMLDEAQDASPVISQVVENQTHAQLIMVGDSNQAIYGWRGAIDAMKNFHGFRLNLTQSFRFGEAVAEEANKWLTLLESPIKLKGLESIPSRLEECPEPKAVLCRTNAEAVRNIMQFQKMGIKAALVGGGDDVRNFCYAALKLMKGEKVDFGPLVAFADWDEVLDYVKNDDSASDLKVAVRLVRDFGAVQVIEAMKNLIDEKYADIIVSTAHKAKGREWESVRIGNDFKPNEDGEMPGSSDMMLSYVSVTRAKVILDRGGLAWVDSLMRKRD